MLVYITSKNLRGSGNLRTSGNLSTSGNLRNNYNVYEVFASAKIWQCRRPIGIILLRCSISKQYRNERSRRQKLKIKVFWCKLFMECVIVHFSVGCKKYTII